jgi:DNA-binding LytR/AlgR family response regulator
MLDRSFANAIEMIPENGDLPAKHGRIAIKVKGRILFVDPAEIVSIEAQRNYVVVRRQSSSDIMRQSISAIAEKLRPYGFLRIHRSIVINAAFVEEIVTGPTGERHVRMSGGGQLAVSRTYKKNLRSISALWIGANSFQTQYELAVRS